MVDSVRARYDVPVTHVVVDLDGRGRRVAGYLPAARRDVVRDRLDLLLVERVLERRHRALAVRHPLDDELLRRLCVVEVRPDRAVRAGVGERVARAAVRGEDRLPVGRLLRRDAGARDRADVDGDVLRSA